MSFVTTQPEALSAAASALQIIGTSLNAQSGAAAGPTANVIPAAADPVSALQAVQFGAYGTWYQHVSAQAAAVHQMLVKTLGASAGSYGQTEAANQTATGSTSLSGLSGALGGMGRSGMASPALSGASSASTSAAAAPSGISTSAGSVLGTPIEFTQNTGAAASDFIALAQGQFLPGSVSWKPPAGVGAASAVGTVSTGTPAGAGGTPVLASMGQASALDRLSVPPSWAAGAVPATGSAAVTPVGAGFSGAVSSTPEMTAMPGGVPSVASAGRRGLAAGAPRYGVKSTVMPKSDVV